MPGPAALRFAARRAPAGPTVGCWHAGPDPGRTPPRGIVGHLPAPVHRAAHLHYGRSRPGRGHPVPGVLHDPLLAAGGAISLAQLFLFLAGALAAGPSATPSTSAASWSATAAAMTLTSAAMAINAAVATVPRHPLTGRPAPIAAGLMGFSKMAPMASVPGMVDVWHFAAAAAMMQIVFQLGVIVGPALGLLLIGLPPLRRLSMGVLRRGHRCLGPARGRLRQGAGAFFRPGSRPRRGSGRPALVPGAAGRLPDRHQRHGVHVGAASAMVVLSSAACSSRSASSAAAGSAC